MNKVIHRLWNFLPEKTKRKIRKILGKEKFRIHPNAASDGSGMTKWIEKIRHLSTIDIQNFIEIGANYGQDAEFVRYYLEIEQNNVYAFEPHPQIISEIRRYYKYNAYDFAISNINGFTKFHAIDLKTFKNSGISSLLKHTLVDEKFYFDTEVRVCRMDTFMDQHKIIKVDFMKIDVEGFTFEVLEGLGERLLDISCIQLEAEHVNLFDGEKLFDDISTLLCKNGFQMVFFEMLDGLQSDSLWIKKDFIK